MCNALSWCEHKLLCLELLKRPFWNYLHVTAFYACSTFYPCWSIKISSQASYLYGVESLSHCSSHIDFVRKVIANVKKVYRWPGLPSVHVISRYCDGIVIFCKPSTDVRWITVDAGIDSIHYNLDPSVWPVAVAGLAVFWLIMRVFIQEVMLVYL